MAETTIPTATIPTATSASSRISSGPLRLDGATVTELARRGWAADPPWGGSAAVLTPAGRQALAGVHRDYVAAGVDVITANTFRANYRSVRYARGDSALAARIVKNAVNIARAVAQEAPRPVLVGASVAPLEDCYRPDLVPGPIDLRVEHRWMAARLADAGVDIAFIETQNTIREARAALSAALGEGLPAWVGFVVGDRARLLSGEPLAEAARAVEQDGASGVLVTCSTPERTEESLRVLAETCRVPIGARPNLEQREPDGSPGPAPEAALDPATFAGLMLRWRSAFSTDLTGGCCGSTPAHLAALGEALAAPTVPTVP